MDVIEFIDNIRKEVVSTVLEEDRAKAFNNVSKPTIIWNILHGKHKYSYNDFVEIINELDKQFK